VTEVVFVGTGDAFGAGGRRQSAILVRGTSGGVLLDCGATTCTGLTDLGIDRGEIAAVLVSHFHGDHFGGIPSLLLACLYEDRRKQPLVLAGPQGIEARVRELAQVIGYGLDLREWTFPIKFQELVAGNEQEVGPVKACTFKTFHQPNVCPHGIAVQSGSERIVFSGDTGWFDAFPGHVAGADLFICECTYCRPDFEFHLNYEDLTSRKGEFDCNKMILTHLGPEMTDRDDLEEIELASDGQQLKI